MTTQISLLTSSALIACIIRSDDPMAHLPPIEINGQRFSLAFNTELALPQVAVDVARAAGINVEILESPALASEGNGDAAAVVEAGGQPDSSGGSEAHFGEPILIGEGNPAPSEEPVPLPPLDTFDAEAIIDGTVEEVAERLEGLGAGELTEVLAAELDRDGSRIGVLDAIDNAAADLSA